MPEQQHVDADHDDYEREHVQYDGHLAFHESNLPNLPRRSSSPIEVEMLEPRIDVLDESGSSLIVMVHGESTTVRSTELTS
jgi:hypothetical protein